MAAPGFQPPIAFCFSDAASAGLNPDGNLTAKSPLKGRTTNGTDIGMDFIGPKAALARNAPPSPRLRDRLMRSLKGFLERRLPRAYGTLQLSWYKYGLQRAFARIMARQGLVVQSGPFQGMKYVPEVATRDRLISHGLLPKLLGCYEQELHGEIAALRRNRYTRIVNIGCAEGYYAVGLARLTADVPVLAFDLDPMARQLCAEMARVNGVADRVTIAAECTSEDLEKLASERALVICDCEGCERTLLCPAVVPSLRTCDLIVELHDCVDPSISRIVPDRFVASHEITLIRRTERDMSAYPAIRRMSPYRQHLAITEFRWGPILWGLFRSRMPPG